MGNNPEIKHSSYHWSKPIINFLKRLVKEKPLGLAGGLIVLAMLLGGIFAESLAPYGFNEIHLADRLKPPSSIYLLGTDNLGRDVLSRIIFGARISMIVGLGASAIATWLASGQEPGAGDAGICLHSSR